MLTGIYSCQFKGTKLLGWRQKSVSRPWFRAQATLVPAECSHTAAGHEPRGASQAGIQGIPNMSSSWVEIRLKLKL